MTKQEVINIMRQNVNPFTSDFKNINDTNCYAYALGIDVPVTELEISSGIEVFNVGVLSGKFDLLHTSEELENALFNDLNVLEIEVQETNFDYQTKENEWKIAMYNTDVFRNYGLLMSDFHFLRQTNNLTWSHKKGFFSNVTTLDSNGITILNPKDAVIYYDDSEKTLKYDYVGTYKLTKRVFK